MKSKKNDKELPGECDKEKEEIELSKEKKEFTPFPEKEAHSGLPVKKAFKKHFDKKKSS